MCILTYIPVHVFMEYVTNTNFDEFVIHSMSICAFSLVPRLSCLMAKNSLVTWANIPGTVIF